MAGSVDHFVSAPVDLTPAQATGAFSRADLVFYGVDARGASFTARVFLDPVGVEPDLSPARTHGFAGFFTIFGHGGCFGDEGHCDIPTERDPFDHDPPHAMTPHTKLVDVTDRLREVAGDAVIVTVLPITRSEGGPELIDALAFTGLTLLSYV